MNKIFTDDSIQNKNLMWHLGNCLYNLERSDEAYPFLKIYIKITKVNSKQIFLKMAEKISLFCFNQLKSSKGIIRKFNSCTRWSYSSHFKSL